MTTFAFALAYGVATRDPRKLSGTVLYILEKKSPHLNWPIDFCPVQPIGLLLFVLAGQLADHLPGQSEALMFSCNFDKTCSLTLCFKNVTLNTKTRLREVLKPV